VNSATAIFLSNQFQLQWAEAKKGCHMKSLFLSLCLFGFALVLGCGSSEPTAADNGTPAKVEEGAKEPPKLPSKAAAAPKE